MSGRGETALPAVMLGGLAMLVCAVGHCAEGSPAELLFRDARQLMRAGDYEAARAKLNESQSRDPSLGTLLNLAICDEHLGRAATAWKEYREVLDSLPAKDPRASLARHGLDALGPTVPRVRFRSAEVSGVLVELDGEPLRVNSGVDVFVDPGVHRVVLLPPGGRPSERLIHVELGEVVQVDPSTAAPVAEAPHLPLPRPEPPSRPRETSSSRSVVIGPNTTLRTAAYVAGGVGFAGFVAAGLLTAAALQEKSTITAHCAGSHCDGDGIRAVDDGARALRLADVGLVLGVAGVVSGGILFWQSSRQSIGARPTVGGASVVYQGALP